MNLAAPARRQFADYYAFMQAEGRSSSTCHHYAVYLNQFARWLDGRDIAHPSALDGKTFLIELSRRRDYRTQTYNQAYYAVRGYLRWLHGDPELNVGLRPRPGKAHARRYLSARQVTCLLGAVPDVSHRCVLELQFATGLRLGESVRVRVRDIERDQAMLVVTEGKGGHGRRVPLAPTIVERLRAHWRRYRPTNWMFPSRQRPNAPVTRGTIQTALRQAARASDIGVGEGTHVLRHSFAMLQLIHGLDIRSLQAILGHRDIGTTMVYLQDLDLLGTVRPRVIDLLAETGGVA
jgi:site-specific recombinase XerD